MISTRWKFWTCDYRGSRGRLVRSGRRSSGTRRAQRRCSRRRPCSRARPQKSWPSFRPWRSRFLDPVSFNALLCHGYIIRVECVRAFLCVGPALANVGRRGSHLGQLCAWLGQLCHAGFFRSASVQRMLPSTHWCRNFQHPLA